MLYSIKVGEQKHKTRVVFEKCEKTSKKSEKTTKKEMENSGKRTQYIEVLFLAINC